MKTILTGRSPATGRSLRRLLTFGALLATLSVPGVLFRNIHAQEAAPPPPETRVLARGPVHEAFSGLVSFNPEPGLIVPKLPPENIVEIPPEEKPSGDNVAWIPGYWAWDEELQDFLWVSGIWRSLPPDREWVPGYWRTLGTTSQWISGYWRNLATTETSYLPPPPRTLEIGPNIPAPGRDYIWAPGCWVWRQNQYAWQPGYWYVGRTDWVWVPATYAWTPGGYVYVEGYWDYPVARRGVLFAPVYYPSRPYAGQFYSYSPNVVIDLALLVDHLFLRPRYHHYYFGDYYDNAYRAGGYYSPFDYHSGRHGYDCQYSHERWAHRGESGWEDSYRASYQKRYDNENERPYRLWSDAGPGRGDLEKRRAIAENYGAYAKRMESSGGYKKISKEERQLIELKNKEFREFRQQRGDTEGKIASEDPWKDGNKKDPLKFKSSKSPMAGSSSKGSGGKQDPPEAFKDSRSPDKDRDQGKKDSPSGQKANQDVDRGSGKDKADKPQGETGKPSEKPREETGKDKSDKPREEKSQPSGEKRKPSPKDSDRDSGSLPDKDRAPEAGKPSPEKPAKDSAKDRGKKPDSKDKGKKGR